MQLDRSLAVFKSHAALAMRNSCDDAAFVELSREAVGLYQADHAIGEYVASLMVGVWHSNSNDWGQEVSTLANLFMDLEVPPEHVSGGQAGAKRRWQAVERLVQH